MTSKLLADKAYMELVSKHASTFLPASVHDQWLTGTALFYSFGPNRRYDSPEGKITGTDDIGARSRPLRLDTHLPE